MGHSLEDAVDGKGKKQRIRLPLMYAVKLVVVEDVRRMEPNVGWSHRDGEVVHVGNRGGNRGRNVPRGCGGRGARGSNRPALGRQMLF